MSPWRWCCKRLNPSAIEQKGLSFDALSLIIDYASYSLSPPFPLLFLLPAPSWGHTIMAVHQDYMAFNGCYSLVWCVGIFCLIYCCTCGTHSHGMLNQIHMAKCATLQLLKSRKEPMSCQFCVFFCFCFVFCKSKPHDYGGLIKWWTFASKFDSCSISFPVCTLTYIVFDLFYLVLYWPIETPLPLSSLYLISHLCFLRNSDFKITGYFHNLEF